MNYYTIATAIDIETGEVYNSKQYKRNINKYEILKKDDKYTKETPSITKREITYYVRRTRQTELF